MLVNKADGSVPNLSPSWSCDSAGDPRLQVPENEFCEVIGQILLHGVTVMLHWLVREAGGKAFVGKDSHRE